MEALKSKIQYQPWQSEPGSLQGEMVQLWQDNAFLGLRTLTLAQALVQTRRWVCASPNAIEKKGAL